MKDLEPTVRTRELGEGLRKGMEKVGLTGQQVAHQLGWPPSQVSRLLSGKRKATPLQVTAVLAVCRVTGAEHDRLLALCQEQHTPGWLQQHGFRLPKQLVTLADCRPGNRALRGSRGPRVRHEALLLFPGGGERPSISLSS